MQVERARLDALETLESWGAPPRLIRHAALVSEVTVELGRGLVGLGASLDLAWAARGAVWHDAGKIWHPDELDAPGRRHEARGQAELLARDVSPDLARVCRSHADRTLALRDEEVLVCCADALWKGKRDPDREADLIARVAASAGLQSWDAMLACDDLFEAAAQGADSRLARS